MEPGALMAGIAIAAVAGCAAAALLWLGERRRGRRLSERLFDLEKRWEAAQLAPQFLEQEKQRLEQQVARLEQRIEETRADERERARMQYEALKTDFDALQRTATHNAELRSAAETTLKELRERLETLTAERDAAQAEQRRATAHSEALATENEVLKVKIEESDRRIKDWETTRENAMQAARAAMLETSTQLSSKLLEDHKREQAEAQKQNEAIVQKTTTQLTEQLSRVTQQVSALDRQTADTRKLADTVWRALTSPSGAGQFAEIGLENLLKNFGFQPEVDFVMQYSVVGDDGRLRPDALLFLPHGRVMVIDCKATKYLMEYAEAADDLGREQALQNLTRRLNQHLKELTSKDYRSAIQAHLRRPGYQSAEILMAMYLPSESALDLVQQADGEFRSAARRAGILLASPTSIDGLFSIFRMQIHQLRQEKNYETIMAAVGALLESVATVAAHATKVGDGIRNAARAYEAFAKSTNRYLLSRARKAMELGVNVSKSKALPPPLPVFTVEDHKHLIEGEATSGEEPVALLSGGEDTTEAA